MTTRHDLDATLPWMRAGSALSAKDGCPAVELARATVPARGASAAPSTGRRSPPPAADLVGWSTGRTTHPTRPVLPRRL